MKRQPEPKLIVLARMMLSFKQILCVFTGLIFGAVAYGSNAGLSISGMPSAEALDESALGPVVNAIGEKPIVLLGESIHLASEFSVARRKIIEALSKKNFQTLYFEGSPVEFWIAEDEYLDSGRSLDDQIAFQKTAFFFLWQTKEISQLVRHALSTQAVDGSQWFYLSSYDVQIGQGFSFLQGRKVFESLTSRLLRRGVALTSSLKASVEKLEGLARCRAKGFPGSDAEYSEAKSTIEELENAIRPIAPEGINPHIDALSMLAKNLEFSLEFCREAKVAGKNYTTVRDFWASEQFEWMNRKFPKKSVIWAHSGHAIGTPRSELTRNFGYYLKLKLPSDIYSIHFTAIGGRAMSFMDDNDNEIEPTEVALSPASAFSFEDKLSKLSASDFFLTLEPNQELFQSEEIARVETSAKMKISPRASFDGYYVIQNLHPPKLFEY